MSCRMVIEEERLSRGCASRDSDVFNNFHSCKRLGETYSHVDLATTSNHIPYRKGRRDLFACCFSNNVKSHSLQKGLGETYSHVAAGSYAANNAKSW